MNCFLSHPLKEFIDSLLHDRGTDNLSYEDFKNELLSKHKVSVKEDDDLCIIYNGNTAETELEKNCRSIILDKTNLKPISTQYNNLLYNNDTLQFLSDRSWNNVVVEQCYEGTMLIVFNHKDKWYITTRRCLNAGESTWINGKSYGDFFNESMNFTWDDLNKDYVYHFVLIHYENRNLIRYNNLGREYKKLYHTLTTEKYTLNEVEHVINNNLMKPDSVNFDSLNSLMTKLEDIDAYDRQRKQLSTEGYILKYYEGELHKSRFTLMKLQTNIYRELMEIKPNNSNINQIYLELYQKDQLDKYLPYMTKYAFQTKTMIHESMKTLSQEILDLYHTTRNKKNTELYSQLGTTYKKVLYKLHGKFIELNNNNPDGTIKINIEEDFLDNPNPNPNPNLNNDNNNDNDNKPDRVVKTIKIHDVYKLLKNLKPQTLRNVYLERRELLKNPENKFLKSCMNTVTQTTLMFKQ